MISLFNLYIFSPSIYLDAMILLLALLQNYFNHELLEKFTWSGIPAEAEIQDGSKILISESRFVCLVGMMTSSCL